MIPGGNNPSGGKTWPRQRVEALRALWLAGHTASEIATILGNGISRNSVISAARRAGCASRQSPITRLTDDQRAARDAKKASQLKLGFTGFPSLKQGATVKAISGAAEADARRRAFAASVAEKMQLADNKNREPVPFVPAMRVDSDQARVPWNGQPVRQEDIGHRQCRWIVADAPPGHDGRDALMCAAPVAAMACRPFCAGHSDRARGRVAAAPSEASGFDLSAPRARSA